MTAASLLLLLLLLLTWVAVTVSVEVVVRCTWSVEPPAMVGAGVGGRERRVGGAMPKACVCVRWVVVGEDDEEWLVSQERRMVDDGA